MIEHMIYLANRAIHVAIEEDSQRNMLLRTRDVFIYYIDEENKQILLGAFEIDVYTMGRTGINNEVKAIVDEAVESGRFFEIPISSW